MEKVLLDKMLKTIELNDQKMDILNLMMNLELNNQNEIDDYYNYASLYKRVCKKCNEQISNINLEEGNEIKQSLMQVNPVLIRQIPFSSILESDNLKFLVFKRINVDLGNKLMQIYNDNEKLSIEKAFSKLGLRVDVSTSNNINYELANECMVSDFNNVLYTEICKLIDSTDYNEERKRLLKIKYNLIYVSPYIERRVLLTLFDTPSYPHLVDMNQIYETGLTYQEYTQDFDEIMGGWLELSIKNCLFLNDFNKTSIDLNNLIYLKCFASCISDSELLDCLTVDANNVHSNNYIKAVNTINSILEESKTNNQKYKTIRKNGNI